MHPTSNFPLLASDQADVIRIFLELMSARRVPEAAADQPAGPAIDSNDSCFPGGGPGDLA